MDKNIMETWNRIPCCTVEGDGEKREEQACVLTEHLLEVFINSTRTFRLVCTPTHLEELAIGRLLSEGYIFSLNDLARVQLSDDGARIDIDIKSDIMPEVGIDVPSACASNLVFARRSGGEEVLPKLEKIPVSEDWVRELATALDTMTPIYGATRGAHSSFLMQDGKILFGSEDIGRHNAMDKVIGWALKNAVDLSKCIILTSGRVPVDMVIKVIRAGIPVLVSKAMPTDKSVELAKKQGLTMICAAKHNRMSIFN